jgi:hypothetical protein
MEANPKLERFLENWLNGGRDTREAFLFELKDLLDAERARCVAIAEEVGRYSMQPNPSDSDLAWKHAANSVAVKIRELH